MWGLLQSYLSFMRVFKMGLKSTEKRRICRKCVMPECKPEIVLDEQGVCNLCREHEKQIEKGRKKEFLETDFIKLLDKHRGGKKYDCLVMCSGGKDSTSALYYMKKRYHLNVLAFTFNNGFETEEALENVRNATQILGVDWIIYNSGYMREMFSDILNSGSKAVLCHACSIWYIGTAMDTAKEFDIPIVVAGWTRGQAEKGEGKNERECQKEFTRMSAKTREFIEGERRASKAYRNFPRSMGEALKTAMKKHKAVIISPHWFMPYDSEHNIELIKRELKWQETPISYPKGSTNCLLNFISSYYSMKNYGYTHYHVEMSKLIREGLLSREDALKQLDMKVDREFLEKIAAKLGHQLE